MTQDGAARIDALRDAIEGHWVRERAPLEVDGCELAVEVAPPDPPALAATLAALGAARLPVLVVGGGSRLSLGNPPEPLQLVLSTHRLAEVDEFDAGDGVAHVRAGTTLEALRAVVRPEGWDVPLDPWGRETTVGGALAAAAVGPRRQGFGAPRDCVLGMEVVLASGTRTKCGGRVVKNVTGYDLAKLYTGSLGTLGVIEGAWLRLRPAPETVSVYLVEAAAERGLAAALDVARRATARVAAALDVRMAGRLGDVLQPGFDAPESPRSGWQLVVELAGDEPAVHRDGRWLREELGGVTASWHEGDGDEVVAALRALQGGEAPVGGLRARLPVLPSQLAAVVGSLAGAAPSPGLLVHPGPGLVYAEFGPLGPDARDDVAAALAATDAAARAGAGPAAVESAPLFAKRERDVFGALAPGAMSLMKALKARFDPNRILNPGRFAGRL